MVHEQQRLLPFPPVLPGNTENGLTRTGLCPPRAVSQPRGPFDQKQPHPQTPKQQGLLSYRLGAARGKSRGVLRHGTSFQIHDDWPAEPGVAGRPGGRSQDCSSVAMVPAASPCEQAGALPPCGAPLSPASPAAARRPLNPPANANAFNGKDSRPSHTVHLNLGLNRILEKKRKILKPRRRCQNLKVFLYHKEKTDRL